MTTMTIAQTVVSSGPKFNVVDILIMCTLVAGVLFAVCKSSMRR